MGIYHYFVGNPYSGSIIVGKPHGTHYAHIDNFYGTVVKPDTALPAKLGGIGFIPPGIIDFGPNRYDIIAKYGVRPIWCVGRPDLNTLNRSDTHRTGAANNAHALPL